MDEAMGRLQQLLVTREVGVVVGEAGSGKSTLLDIFLNRVSSTRYRVIHIPIPQTRPRELYRSIAAALGVNTSWFGADALKVVDLLTYSYLESNRPNLLLIDEAHILTPTCLNELRLLTNATGKHEAVVTLVLLGQPSLSTTLKLPALIPLAQRIGAWITLGGLNEEETCRYIDWQVQTAGGPYHAQAFSLNELKDDLKQRVDEIVQAMNSRDSLLEEFDEQIFNALVEKIEVLTPTHFVFELKSGMRVEEFEA